MAGRVSPRNVPRVEFCAVSRVYLSMKTAAGLNSRATTFLQQKLRQAIILTILLWNGRACDFLHLNWSAVILKNMHRGAGCDMQYSYKRRGSSSEEEPPKRQRVNDSDLQRNMESDGRMLSTVLRTVEKQDHTIRELKALLANQRNMDREAMEARIIELQEEQDKLQQKIKKLEAKVPNMPALVRAVKAESAENVAERAIAKLQADFDAHVAEIKQLTAPVNDSGPKCVVCTDDAVSSLVLPCRHLCMCAECAVEVQRAEINRCPVCRGAIDRIIPGIYLP